MSDRTLRMVALLALIALGAGIGCGGGAESRDDSAKNAPEIKDPAQQEPGTPAPAASPDTQKAVQVQASSPEMEKIATELARGRSAQEQQQIYESQRH